MARWRCASFYDTYDPPVKKRSNHTCNSAIRLVWFCFTVPLQLARLVFQSGFDVFNPQPSTLCKSNSTTHPLMALWDAWNEVVCICLLGWRAAFSETPSNTFQHHQLQGFLSGTIKHEYGSNRHENQVKFPSTFYPSIMPRVFADFGLLGAGVHFSRIKLCMGASHQTKVIFPGWWFGIPGCP